jgi:hypothetical protein
MCNRGSQRSVEKLRHGGSISIVRDELLPPFLTAVKAKIAASARNAMGYLLHVAQLIAKTNKEQAGCFLEDRLKHTGQAIIDKVIGVGVVRPNQLEAALWGNFFEPIAAIHRPAALTIVQGILRAPFLDPTLKPWFQRVSNRL